MIHYETHVYRVHTIIENLILKKDDKEHDDIDDEL